MLPLPNLNDQPLDVILQYAIEQLHKGDARWRDFHVHDPGITLLELLSVLKSGQVKQMNQITVRSLEKFLKLLGIKRQRNICAKTKAAFSAEQDYFLPKGYQLKAGDIVYEAVTSAKIVANKIVDFGNETPTSNKIYTYEKENLKRESILFEQAGDCFVIGLEKPLPSDTEIHFYVSVTEGMVKRNPPSADFIPLSAVVWEYYDGEWQTADVCIDETYGFLYSGNVVLRIHGEHCGRERKSGDIRFDLRARCVKYGYETIPKLDYIMLNSLDFVQKDTKCETITFSYDTFQKNDMQVVSYLASSGIYELYIRSGEQYVKAEDMGIQYMLLEQKYEGWRLATSKRAILEKVFQGRKTEDVVFLLVLYEETFYPHRILGESFGSTHQEFILQNNSNADYDSFSFLSGSSELGWQTWKKVDSLDGCLPSERCYMFREETVAIRFGDNKHGAVPVGKSQLLIHSFATTQGEAGDIREQVLEISDDAAIEVFHFFPGKGGKKAETTEELMTKMKNALENKSRAVTKEDYIKLANETPGLAIGQISVLPLYRPDMKGYPAVKEENTVTLMVEPAVFTQNPIALQGYVDNIQKHMEQYRLITTRLFVAAVEYIPIDIYLEIKVTKRTVDFKERIQEKLMAYVKDARNRDMGATLYYGEVCLLIESFEHVERIKFLQMETPSQKTEQNNFGDIKIPYYAKAYVRRCEITFF